MVEEFLSSATVCSGRAAAESDRSTEILQAETQTLVPPDPDVLQLYRYLWLPARYAAPEWLQKLGFKPAPHWRYGIQPELDHSLDCALRMLRGTFTINATMDTRQKILVRLVPRLASLALGLGLVKIWRSDYFMLPEYRKVLRRWLSEEEIWRLYGWCGQKSGHLLSPKTMAVVAIQIGTAILHRAARNESVLQVLLILLPPPARALWPQVSFAALSFLENLL